MCIILPSHCLLEFYRKGIKYTCVNIPNNYLQGFCRRKNMLYALPTWAIEEETKCKFM